MSSGGRQLESVLPKSESAPRKSESDPGRNPTRVGVGLTAEKLSWVGVGIFGSESESDFLGRSRSRIFRVGESESRSRSRISESR